MQRQIVNLSIQAVRFGLLRLLMRYVKQSGHVPRDEIPLPFDSARHCLHVFGFVCVR
jgi:hypothetical protein